MAHADLFVLSSSLEGPGIVLIEALACGCPIVTVDCPSGPCEILANARFGALVPMDDAAALALSMKQALATPVDKTTLSKRAEDFSLQNGVEAYVAWINDVLNAEQALAAK